MAYEVHLEVFEGPLDLLLFLIKKDDLDINNIPIAEITQEYLDALDLLRELNLDVAGEFLVLAATLMAIKAKTLLPGGGGEADEGPDPRSELVAKLLDYQRFKAAAKVLELRAEEFKNVFYRGSPRFDESQKSLSIGFYELLESLRRILDRAEESRHEIVGEEYPIEDMMAKILFLLEGRPNITFEDIFADERKRRGIISCFLALLELIRLRRVEVRQETAFGPIRVIPRAAPPAETLPLAPDARSE